LNGEFMSRIYATVASIIIGAGFAVVMGWCWAYVAAYNLLPVHLLGAVHGLSFLAAIAIQDFVIHLLLSLPAAWLLVRIGAKYLWSTTALAAVVYAVTSILLGGVPAFSSGALVIIQYILQLAALPLAVWLLSKVNTPNYSFQRTAGV